CPVIFAMLRPCAISTLFPYTTRFRSGDAAEVADARQRHVDQAVEELVHLRAAQGDLAADRPAVADLERGHRHARLGDHRLLARDLGHVGDGVLEDLLVGRGLAHAHVERDLLQARDLHRIGVAEALHQLRHHFFLVELFKSGGHRGIPQASSASPLERNTRSLRPSSSTLIPMRSPLPVAGLNSITFETWIGASRSTTPPGCPACGFGLVWRLTRFTLDTTTLSPWTLTTSPRLPLSLPVVTTTWSPLRIRFIFLPPLRALRVRARRSSGTSRSAARGSQARRCGCRSSHACCSAARRRCRRSGSASRRDGARPCGCAPRPRRRPRPSSPCRAGWRP